VPTATSTGVRCLAPSVPKQMMTMVVVFGGGGFFGRRLVHRLTAPGMTVRVAVRHPDHARIELQSIGFDRVTVVPADVRDQASVAAAIAGADAVVNTVSAYVEKGGVTFEEWLCWQSEANLSLPAIWGNAG
jgi:NAD(P)-dependent dehydrogenase (short-subunit alcohol dehydrogenase family)